MKAEPTLLSFIRDSFWSRVNRCSVNGHIRSGPCWEWKGSKRNGYGRFRLRGLGRSIRWFNAHRIAWELWNGRPVPEGKSVLHHCDNPGCCRPGHLYLGTQTKNMQDRKKRNPDSYEYERDAKGRLTKLKKGKK